MTTGKWQGSSGATIALAAIATLLGVHSSPGIIPRPVTHVIHISMDGLRPDAITSLEPTDLPNFYRLRTEGAFTDNARTDFDYTVTLPNHVSQLTGRGVLGDAGHNWTGNVDPAEGQTLASNKGAYIAGVFDMTHDRGLHTGLYASKSKFSLFDVSWNETNGAPDIIGTDEGNDKIDVFVLNDDTAALANTMAADMADQPFGYVFIHFRDPDSIGHGYSWDVTPGSAYSDTVRQMDERLGLIFTLVDTNAELAGHTAIILTADHGGLDYNHGDNSQPEIYTIPFYVWGPGVMAGADLYALNPHCRLDPCTNRPPYTDPVQPIRNGEAANTALQLLGLWPIPGSTINSAQNLVLSLPPPPDFRIVVGPLNHSIHFSTDPKVHYDIQCCGNLRGDLWTNCLVDIIGTGSPTNIDLGRPTVSRFYRLKAHF